MSAKNQLTAVANKLNYIAVRLGWLAPDVNWQSLAQSDQAKFLDLAAELKAACYLATTIGLPLSVAEEHEIHHALLLAEKKRVKGASNARAILETGMVKESIDQMAHTGHKGREIEVVMAQLNDPEWPEYRRLRKKFGDD